MVGELRLERREVANGDIALRIQSDSEYVWLHRETGYSRNLRNCF